MSHTSSIAHRSLARLSLALLVCCAFAFTFVGLAFGAVAQTDWSSRIAPVAAGGDAATVEQCVNTGEQADRSATFSAEMTAVPGTARMAMRIEVQERMPGEEIFHTVSAPGLGVWRGSAPGVKIYQYVKQVTNLTSPAVYRALVRFHWLNDKGRVIRRGERFAPRCEQPASPVTATPVTPTPAPGGSTGFTSPSSGG